VTLDLFWGAGFAGVVEIIQSKVEELALDAQVDVLVSEPMGTCCWGTTLQCVIRERKRQRRTDKHNHHQKLSDNMLALQLLLFTAVTAVWY